MGAKKHKISEELLAASVVSWLELSGWDVYQEVMLPGRDGTCDIIAKKGELTWAIECKTSMGFPVLGQASAWGADFRSVAVLRTKSGMPGHVRRCALLYYKCGIIEVTQPPTSSELRVSTLVKAPLMEKSDSPFIIKHLLPGHKTHARAGTRGGNVFTPYRRTMEEVQKIVAASPGCCVVEIVRGLGGVWHWSTNSESRARAYMKKLLLEVETTKWCLICDGQYYHWGASSDLKSRANLLCYLT